MASFTVLAASFGDQPWSSRRGGRGSLDLEAATRECDDHAIDQLLAHVNFFIQSNMLSIMRKERISHIPNGGLCNFHAWSDNSS